MVLVGLALCLLVRGAHSQQVWSPGAVPGPAPALEQAVYQPIVEPEVDYFFPDLPSGFIERLQVDRPYFSAKSGMVLTGDYNAFSQDAGSLLQVGQQRDGWDGRSARLYWRGKLGIEQVVGYHFGIEFNGFESDTKGLLSLTDLSFDIPVYGPETTLTIGKTKESFSYERVSDTASLPFQERVLEPFYVARSTGLRLNHVIGPDQRMTAACGIFNEGLAGEGSLNDTGTDFTARLTGLVWDRGQQNSFLHLGAAGRRAGASDDVLQFRGRPESNVTDFYVDTGAFAADEAWIFGLEALWSEGPFSILAEYNRAWVDATASADPELSGYYITGSWVMTGESRPYDKAVGFARHIAPRNRWGAFELVGRFSNVDLDDVLVAGGTFDKTYLGLNWWANRRTRIGIGWGHTRLDRFGTEGETDSVQTRFLWTY